MSRVNTVLGPINTSDLGFTLMHEHILAMSWAMRESLHGWFDKDRVVEKAVGQLCDAKKRGVKTIVDATPINLGRDIHLIREVAERAEMQIIVATGFYWTEEPVFNYWEVDQLVDFLLPDIERGIQGTSCKAGIIKCATDVPGVSPQNKKLLQVAARLHKATGLPITTHSHAAKQNGLDQQAVFREEGVDLSQVIIGHTGDSEDIGYIEKLLEAGSYIGMDRFGLDVLMPHETRVSIVAELCKRRHVDRMVLSHDAVCHLDWFSEEAKQAHMPNWQFCFIPDRVIPDLKKKGVTEQQIDVMTRMNPSRIFSVNAKLA